MSSQIGFSAEEQALADLRQELIKGLRSAAILLEEEMGWVTPEDPIAEMHKHMPSAPVVQAFKSATLLECTPLIERPEGQRVRLIAAMRAAHQSGSPRTVDSSFVPLFDHLQPALTFAEQSLAQVQFLLLAADRYDELCELAGESEAAHRKRLERLHKLDPKSSASSAYQRIIRSALNLGASDIHIEPAVDGYRVRFRVHGDLQARYFLSGERGERIGRELVNVIKIDAGLKIEEHRLPQDGRVSLEEEMSGYSLRVSIVPTQAQKDAEKVVLRLLKPANPEQFNLDDLGLSSTIVTSLRETLRSTSGIVLVTGPTGSGKTTTLYSVLRELNDGARNISTVEDPVEVRFPDMNQSQVKPGIGLTFSSLLRAFLRQDPDIILVGEIRDEETARIAVRAAQTGHLVLSTLHTNDACGVLPRLKGMQVSGEQLQGALRAVLAQRLVRQVCSKCAMPYDAREELGRLLQVEPGQLSAEPIQLVRPRPQNAQRYCKACANTGYAGRIPVAEIWIPTPEEMHRIIYDPQFTDRDLSRLAIQGGMRPIWLSAFELAVRGRTTLEDVIDKVLGVSQLRTEPTRSSLLKLLAHRGKGGPAG